ncbi:MAG: hypothetical protein ABI903_10215 [Actinomycetota bacterium]
MKNAQIAFYVVGFVLSVASIVKLSIIGVYPSEEPVAFGILITGLVCTFIGSKIHPETRD